MSETFAFFLRPCNGLKNDKHSLFFCLTLQHAVIARR